MRKRFRGNQPVNLKQIEGGSGRSSAETKDGGSPSPSTRSGGDKGYQLYAGRSAFAGAARETSGSEPEPRDWRELENEQYRREQAQNGRK